MINAIYSSRLPTSILPCLERKISRSKTLIDSLAAAVCSYHCCPYCRAPAKLLPFTRSLFVPRACFSEHIINFCSILLSLPLLPFSFSLLRTPVWFLSAASLQMTNNREGGSPSRRAPGRRRRVSLGSRFLDILFLAKKPARLPRRHQVERRKYRSVGGAEDRESRTISPRRPAPRQRARARADSAARSGN